MPALEGDSGDREPGTVAHLREAMELSPDAAERAVTALELGDALWAASRPQEAVRAFDAARDEISETDSRLALLLEAHALGASLFALSSAEDVHARLTRIRVPSGTTTEERLLLGVLAYQRAVAGAASTDVVRLCDRALGSRPDLGEAATPLSLNFAPVALVFAEALDRAEWVFARILADAAKRAIRTVAIARCWSSRIAYLQGSVADAEADARAALGLPMREVGSTSCL